MAYPPLPVAPDRIDIAPDIYARKVHNHYVLTFPFDPRANARVASAIGVHFYKPSGGWLMDSHRFEALDRLLREVDQILGPRPSCGATSAPRQKPDRILVADDGSVRKGSLLQTRKGRVMVNSLGRAFLGDEKLAQWGHPELVGRMVCYAYHSPAPEVAREPRVITREDPEEAPAP